MFQRKLEEMISYAYETDPVLRAFKRCVNFSRTDDEVKIKYVNTRENKYEVACTIPIDDWEKLISKPSTMSGHGQGGLFYAYLYLKDRGLERRVPDGFRACGGTLYNYPN